MFSRRKLSVLLAFALFAGCAGSNSASFAPQVSEQKQTQQQEDASPNLVFPTCNPSTPGCPGQSGQGAIVLPTHAVNLAASAGATTNSGTGEAFDADSGALLATVSGTYAATSVTYTADYDGSPVTINTIRPDQIIAGDNALPGGGNLNVNATTNVVTATTTGVDGTKYIITATPNASGYVLTVAASNGMQWSQTFNAPPGATTSLKHRSLVFSCRFLSDADLYFGGVASIAGGVAFFAAAVGAEPVAALAGGVGALSEVIAGVASLGKFFGGCA